MEKSNEIMNGAVKNQKINKSAMNIAKKVVIVADALLLTGLLYSAAIFKGVSYEIPKNATVSHFAAYTEIPEKVLARRNKLKDNDYIRAGDDFIIYHSGPQGFLENVVDGSRDILNK